MEEVVPSACPLPLNGVTQGPWAHAALGLLPSLLARTLGPCLLHSGSTREKGMEGGGLHNVRPLALKIHAKQLFLLGACSWIRLWSGSRGAETGGNLMVRSITPNSFRAPSRASLEDPCQGVGQVGSV